MSNLIIGDQELLLAERKRKLVYPGSTLSQDKHTAALKEQEAAELKAKEDAINAPTPNIGIPGYDVLLRAVPMIQERSTSGVITINYDNITDSQITEMSKLSYLVEFTQELLVVGDQVAEAYPSLKEGMMVRFDETRFSKGRANAAHLENEVYFDIPVIKIGGFIYLHMAASDILYYLKD